MNNCEDHTVVRDTSPRSRELLVKAARMYFLDGRSQDDIARVLETSRSNVSRMLGVARTLGIVEIRIQDERGRDADLEEALARQFDLTHVRVAAFRPQQDPVAATSALAAEWLDNTLRDGQILALSWGTAVQATVAAVAVDEPRRVEVVPLVGGLATARHWQRTKNWCATWLRGSAGPPTDTCIAPPYCIQRPHATHCSPSHRSAIPWHVPGRPTSHWLGSEHSARARRRRSSGVWASRSRSATPSCRGNPSATRAAASSTLKVGRSEG